MIGLPKHPKHTVKLVDVLCAMPFLKSPLCMCRGSVQLYRLGMCVVAFQE